MVDVQPQVSSIRGFKVAGVHSGMKKEGLLDFALIVSDAPCVAAGVFTKNRVKAAPVWLDMDRLARRPNDIRAVAINTTCANACTGKLGLENAAQTAEWVAQDHDFTPEQVLLMSTGVIGTHLPMTHIKQGVERAYSALGVDWHKAALAIMTTDTRPKLASVEVMTPNGNYTLVGISKGAGMIAPNMATMLGLIVTDAALTVEQARSALGQAVASSFNRIVVDGDMSTNDTVLLLANGKSHIAIDTAYERQQFQEALNTLCIYLAQAIVRDGEGATKFITLHITGAEDDEAARLIGHAIGTSALVKTAFFGQDANWGRIIAAAGRAGVAFNPERASLWISPGEELFEDDKGLLLFQAGVPTAYDERAAAEIMAEPAIYVSLDCGLGEGSAVIWTCDLSAEYVAINADYRS